jgi:hypothetical protein
MTSDCNIVLAQTESWGNPEEEIVMLRKRISVQPGGVALLAVASLSTGMAIAACGSSAHRPATASSATRTSTAVSATALGTRPGYPWYRSMMSRSYRSGRMTDGRSRGWLTSRAGYRWMTGGTLAPGWMSAGAMSSAKRSTMSSADPGSVVGGLFAGAPGARVSPAKAQRLAGQLPAGAKIDRATRTIVFTARNVHLVVLASPSAQDESYRIAGMTNPTVSVRRGAHVTMELINANDAMANGLVITAFGAARSPMPMMITTPAFRRSVLWFLGDSTAAGMPAGTLTFTAARRGTYQYLCPVPGHAQLGMAGTFTVR